MSPTNIRIYFLNIRQKRQRDMWKQTQILQRIDPEDPTFNY